MPQRAHVTSAEALEAFRAKLIVYVGQARSTLEEVSADVLRMRTWIENDQRLHWEREMRRRTRELQEAQQALFSARMSNLRQESSAEQLAVHRAKRSVDEAETKLRIIKHWNRDFDNRVQPLVKQMDKMHTILANDMIQATASLNQAITTLAAYTEVAPPTDLATGAVAPAAVPVDPAGSASPGAPPAAPTEGRT